MLLPLSAPLLLLPRQVLRLPPQPRLLPLPLLLQKLQGLLTTSYGHSYSQQSSGSSGSSTAQVVAVVLLPPPAPLLLLPLLQRQLLGLVTTAATATTDDHATYHHLYCSTTPPSTTTTLLLLSLLRLALPRLLLMPLPRQLPLQPTRYSYNHDSSFYCCSFHCFDSHYH